ncbi:MAG: hypothetical protein MUC95_07915, partial [Spirochaetes bacterium]|nr:hypothetical protein [Spirochaetota bacterium]
MKNKEKKINPFKINRQNRKICTASGIFFSLLLCINPVFGQTGADNSPVSSPKTEKAESQVPAGSAVKETPEKTRVNVEKTDGNPAEKDITNKVEPNIENKDIKQTKKDDFTPAAPVKKIEQPGDADGLLKITEGSYKYRRIPDIKIPDDSDSKADNSKEQEEV